MNKVITNILEYISSGNGNVDIRYCKWDVRDPSVCAIIFHNIACRYVHVTIFVGGEIVKSKMRVHFKNYWSLLDYNITSRMRGVSSVDVSYIRSWKR